MIARNEEPTPIGCFKDGEDRDLDKKLAKDLTTDDCINLGKVNNYRYVGLQNGDECWGGNSVGSLGLAKDSECHKPCSRDINSFCGAGFRNLVYDTRNLNR